MPFPALSIIIPCLNEAGTLPALLADLKAQQGVALDIVIADGGSQDDTLARCRPYAPVIISTPRGRARQMNAGALKASGDDLLFLHADSKIRNPRLLATALAHWRAAMDTAGHDRIAGHFPLRFMRSNMKHSVFFRYTEGKTHFNRINTTNGDQGMLITRSFFESLNGFDESQHFLEDQKLAEKIRADGRWITLPGHLVTSGRRFETEGHHRRYILMSMLMALHSTGYTTFFDRAADIYVPQDQTGFLPLTPYFTATVKMFVYDLGLMGSLRAWYRIGRYIRQNSWQMFYFFDVLFRTSKNKHGKPGGYPFLLFHDQYFGPATSNAVCDAINTFISFFWFMLVLAPFFLAADSWHLLRALVCGRQKATQD